MALDSNLVSQLVVAVILAFIALILGAQKIIKKWKEDSTEASVITIMHSELERMSKQNSILASELNKLQLEIIKLTKELHELTKENQKLNLELASLSNEVTRLQRMLGSQYGVEGDVSET